MIKVTKFGGSSVANAIQFKKVKHIIDSDSSRLFIVTSACGKSNSEDHKITDLLYLCYAHVQYGVSCESIFTEIEEKYYKIKEKLGLTIDLQSQFSIIRSQLKKGISQDYLVSRGEYLTALCLAEYLHAKFIDARDCIAFSYEGEIDLERTKQLLHQYIEPGVCTVIPGFYGSLPNGVIKVMSRGGSDITGSILANVLDAQVYENWTDVSGFMVADPHIINNPLRISCITYSELRQMSYMGANVLHDDAVFPVRSKNIPINIRNTNEPDNPGTMIMNDCSEWDKKETPHFLTGITGRKDYTVITLVKSHSSTEVGFLRKILEVFEEYHVSIESVPITVDTFSIIVQSSLVEPYLYEIAGKLKKTVHPDELHIEENLALIAVVGRAMKKVPGMSGRLLSEFGRNHINIKVINQSSDELSIVVGVDDHDFEKAIQYIYEKFIIEESNR